MTADVAPRKRRASTAGIIVTIVLCVVLIGFGALMAFLSFFFAFASDSCGDNNCNDGGIATGILIALVGCAVSALVGVVFGIIWAARRKRLGWIFPIAGGVAVTACFAIGAAITATSVPY